jgi:hypothetical protein
LSDDIKKLWTDEWIEHEGLRIIPPKEVLKKKGALMLSLKVNLRPKM